MKPAFYLNKNYLIESKQKIPDEKEIRTVVRQRNTARKCQNTEFFLVRIFLYSDQTRLFKLRIWTLFT